MPQASITQIRWVKNVETFNLKSATEDTSLMSRGKQFHSPTILFMKLNLNELVLEWLVKTEDRVLVLHFSGAYHLEPSSPNWAGATAFSHLELFLELLLARKHDIISHASYLPPS